LIGARASKYQISLLEHEYQLNHKHHLPHVLFSTCIVEYENTHAMVYEHMNAVSLRSWLFGKKLNLKYFFKVTLSIIDCLDDLHKNNIIHKDIQPDNFLIDPDTLEVKLLNMTYATQLTSLVQEIGDIEKIEGNLAYISPEQTGRVNQSVDYRSDYYSLGITQPNPFALIRGCG